MTKLKLFAVAIAAVLLAAQPAQAAVVTYDISGTVGNVFDFIGGVFPGVLVGDSFTGSFSYETDQSQYGSLLGSPASNYSNTPAGPLSISLSVGGLTFTSDGSGPAIVDIANDTFNGVFNFDRFILEIGQVVEQSFLSEGISIILIDASGNVFSDTSIPGTLDLADFDDPTANLSFVSTFFDFAELNLTIDSMVLAPEPSSTIPEPSSIIIWSLLGVTSCGTGYWRRRRSRRR